MKNSGSARLSRRQAISVLGAGAGSGLLLAATPVSSLLAATWRSTGSTATKGAFGKSAIPQAGAIIRTIFADLSPEELARGRTLFHEHLSAAYSRTELQPVLPPPSSADTGPVIEDVRAAARDGVTCIVDGGHPDMGRNMEHLRQISRETGVHVVASGGYYRQSTYPLEISAQSEDQIAADLAAEAATFRYGAFGEIGQMPDLPDFTPDERKMFRAVGKAHILIGLPIFTHSPYGTGPNVPREIGLRQLDLLESVGVDPQHVTIGHACCLDEPSAEIIKQVAMRGAYVGFDRLTGGRVADPQKVETIMAFLEAGYGNKLLLSSDRRREFNRTTSVFVPKLLAAGVDAETVRTVLVDNPARFLAFLPKEAA